MREDQIGGGVVRRTFRMGDRQVMAGMALTAEQIMAIRPANRNALIEKKMIEIYPRPPQEQKLKRIIVSAGFGKYHVIEGRKLNRQPLEKKDAEALAKRGEN